jgi:ribosomal-protein-alanine N-acetyltransferase
MGKLQSSGLPAVFCRNNRTEGHPGQEKAMVVTFHPMDEASAREICTWCYEPPYDFYNPNSATEACVRHLLDPSGTYYAITDGDGTLVGYCCFGADAQVPGGTYDEPALDIGLGMRPALTGQGHGDNFFAAIVDFALLALAPRRLRVTVAAFNRRAMRVYERAGFRPVESFGRSGDGAEFVIMTCWGISEGEE